MPEHGPAGFNRTAVLGAAGRRAADPKAEFGAAKAAALTEADLPGFKVLPDESVDDADGTAANSKLAACMSVDAALFDDAPTEQTAVMRVLC